MVNKGGPLLELPSLCGTQVQAENLYIMFPGIGESNELSRPISAQLLSIILSWRHEDELDATTKHQIGPHSYGIGRHRLHPEYATFHTGFSRS